MTPPPLEPELRHVFGGEEKFAERERRTRAAVVLENEEVLVWWAMERNETLPQTRLFFERQLAGYHDPDTYFLTTTAKKFRDSSPANIVIENDMYTYENDDEDIHDDSSSGNHRAGTVDADVSLAGTSNKPEFDDERLYEGSPSQNPSMSASWRKQQQQQQETRAQQKKGKQKQQRKDGDDEMLDDNNNDIDDNDNDDHDGDVGGVGGVGIGVVGESAAAGASAGRQ